MKIELNNISKIYNPHSQVPTKALDNVSYSFNESGMYFIVGPSGCGKTTLLNILGGLDKPTSGEIIVNKKSTKKFTSKGWDKYRNRHIGFVFQDYGLIEDYTVNKNIELPLELQYKLNKKNKVNEILRKFGLSIDKKRKPNELSGGQKQRVAIARALIKEPDIVLADEPTGNLDSRTSEQIFDYLKEYAIDHIVIVVSHSTYYAQKYADKIIHMQDGKIETIQETQYEIEEDAEEEVENFEEDTVKDINRNNSKIVTKGMSIKSVILYALKNIKTNAFRYITALLLFVTMTILAQIGIIANRYDRIETAYKTIIKSGLTNIEIASDEIFSVDEDGTDYVYEQYGENKVAIKSVLEKDIVNEIENIKGKSFCIYPIYNQLRDEKTLSIQNGFIMQYDEDLFEQIGFKIIAGGYPTTFNNALLSKRDADIYISQHNYQEGNYDSLIGDVIYHISNYGFQIRISGIVDTGYDATIEQASLSIKRDANFELNLDNFKKQEDLKRIHHTTFVNEYLMYRYYEITGPLYLNRVKEQYNQFQDTTRYFDSPRGEVFGKEFVDDMCLVNNNNIDYFLIDGYDENTELKDDEIILSLEKNNIIEPLVDILTYMAFNESNYKKDKSSFDQAKEKVLYEIRQNPIYVTGHFSYSNETEIDIDKYNEMLLQEKQYRVVGFYHSQSSYNGYIVNDTLFEENANELSGVSAILFDLKNSTKASSMALLNYLDTSDDDSLNHLYVNDLKIADERAESLKTIGIEVAIIFGFIGVILIFSMFVAMINKNTRQLGIFRALGASKYNMMGMYLIQSVLLFIITTIISCLLLPITASFVQGSSGLGIFAPIFKDAATLESASSSYSIELIDVLEVTNIDYLTMTIFAVGTILLSTIIPIFYKLNKKPIDLMRTKDD